MSGDELISELFRRQGFLAVPASENFEIGEIRKDFSYGGKDITIPLRIIGTASREQLKSQRRLQLELGGGGGYCWHPAEFIFLAEAAD